MIIEISGIDGSGKTTLGHHLAGWFIRLGRRPYLRSLKQNSRRILTHLAQQQGETRKQLFTQQGIELVSAYEFMQNANSLLNYVEKCDEIFIMEPYILANLAGAAAYEVSNLNGIQSVLQHVPSPDFSIHLSISPEVAYERARNRPSSDVAVIKSGLAHLEKYAWGFTEALSRISYPVVSVDSEVFSVDEILDQIEPSLMSKLQAKT